MGRKRLGLFRDDDRNAEAITTILKGIPSLHRGTAYSDGDCFFDSVAQGLMESKIQIPVRLRENIPAYKKLRILCQQYVRGGDHPDHKWIESAIIKDSVEISDVKEYARLIEFTAPEMEQQYELKKAPNEAPIWGRPEVEGRIFCALFGIKIHFIELIQFENKLIPGHQLITAADSKTVHNADIDYNDKKTIHIIGYKIHFTPMLRNKEPPQELEAKPKKTKQKKPTTQENKTMSRLSSGNNANDVKIEIKEQKNFKYQDPELSEYDRRTIITKQVEALNQDYVNALNQTPRGSPSYQLYELLAYGLQSGPNRGDGWEQQAKKNILNLSRHGKKWGDPKQEESIESLRKWLKKAQACEVGFGVSTAGMSIYDYYDSLSPSALAGLSVVLVMQAAAITYINYHGINPDKDSRHKICPTIRIGNFILEGVDLREAKPGEKANIEFKIDNRFNPKEQNYNAEAVTSFIHDYRIYLEEKTRYSEKELLTKINSVINTISYFSTNYSAASINWMALPFVIDLIITGVDQYIFSFGDTGKIALSAALCLPFLPPIVYSGVQYYEAFTIESINLCVKKFFTSDNPLLQTFRISKSQGLEVSIQWLLNGLTRGFGVGLGVFLVVKYLSNYLQTLLSVSVPSNLTQVGAIFAGVCTVHNTWESRMKGAKIYLGPFERQGPFGEAFTVPTKRLLAPYLPEVKLTPLDKIKITLWASLQGALLGISTCAAWSAIIGEEELSTSTPALITALIVYALKASLTYSAESNHLHNQYANESRKNKIKAVEIAEETKHELDANGNIKLTAADSAVYRFNFTFVLIDQVSRVLSRSGVIEGILRAYGIELGTLNTLILFNFPFIIPQLNEFMTYFYSTQDQMVDQANGVREWAGKPSNEIQGKLESLRCFMARQLVCFAPFFFGGGNFCGNINYFGPGIKGITDQSWGQWFTSCGAPLPIDVSEVKERETKEGKQEISEPISASSIGNIRSIQQPLLAREGAERPAAPQGWATWLKGCFCLCRERRPARRTASVSVSLHEAANNSGASYTRLA